MRKFSFLIFTSLAFLIVVSTGCHNTAPKVSAVKNTPNIIKTEPFWETSKLLFTAPETQPGENHKKLAPLVGRWEVASKFWIEPGKNYQSSKATVNRRWALGKRFVQEIFEDRSADAPYAGIGYYGFDRITNEFTSTWLDTASTGVYQSTGRLVNGGSALEFSANTTCPTTKEPLKLRSRIKFLSDNEHHFEMFESRADGLETLVMEGRYIRVVN